MSPFILVLLSTKSLRLQGSKKLLPRFVGPFTVTAVVGKHAYRLALPPHTRIHSEMHVSLLKPFRASDRSQPPPTIMMIDEHEDFEVDSILLHRNSGKKSLEDTQPSDHQLQDPKAPAQAGAATLAEAEIILSGHVHTAGAAAVALH